MADRLVREAIAITRADGPQSLSLREVQRRAGVSPAAAYRHFRDRDAMLETVGQEAAGILTDHVVERIAAADPSSDPVTAARSRLLAQCDGYLDFAFAEPGLYRAAFSTGGRADELTTPSQRALGRGAEGGYNLLARTFTDLVAAAGLTASPWDPMVVWSTCHGFVMLRLDGQLQSLTVTDFQDARQHLLNTVVDGIALRWSDRRYQRTAESDGQRGPQRTN